MARLFSITFKLILFSLLLTTIGAGLLAWRLISTPIATTALTASIEAVFERFVPGTTAKIGESSLTWDNQALMLAVTCANVRLLDKDEREVLTFPSAQIKISLGGLVRGRVLPREMSADNARFWLTRDKNGILFFGAPNQAEQSPHGHGATNVFSLLNKLAQEVSHDRLEHRIDLKNIVFSLHDHVSGQNWDIVVPEVSLDHNGKDSRAKAMVRLSEKERTTALQLNYVFLRPDKRHHIALTFQDVLLSSFAGLSPDLAILSGAAVPVSGSIDVRTDTALSIDNATAKLSSGPGLLTYPQTWKTPRAVASASFEASFDHEEKSFLVPTARIDFEGGTTLSLKAQAALPSPETSLWLNRKTREVAFTATVALSNLPMDRFDAIWPRQAVPDARDWILAHLSGGAFTQGEASVKGRLNLDAPQDSALDAAQGTIDAQGVRVSYLDGMPPIENTSAHATFDLDHMDVHILGGHTGAVHLVPFTLTMNDFQKDVQTIVIPARLKGPTTEILSLLDSPPLGYAKEIGLDPKDSSGQVEGTLTLRMPMLDALLLKDVEVKAEARLKDFSAQKLVPGIALSRGALDLALTKDGFALKGQIALNAVPTGLKWKSRFNPAPDEALHEAEIDATLQEGQWDAFYGLGSLLKTQGETPVALSYKNLRPGLSKINGTVNLKRAAVQVPSIAWQKPSNIPSQATFSLTMKEGEPLSFTAISLQGKDVKVKATATLDATSGQLTAFRADPFIVGRSNAIVHYEKPVDPTLPLTIRVEGEAFDISGFETVAEKEAGTKAQPKTYDLKLTRLYTSEQGFMASLSGHARRDKDGWRDIDLWGVAQGSVPVYIRLEPKNDGLAFKMISDDFGLALKGLGLSDSVKGGTLEINGESNAQNPRMIDGKIKVGAFTVSDVPVLARLLSAVSPFGFVDLITGDAAFDHLRGYYRWQGDVVDLRDVRAAGSVVGINLDGRIDMGADSANLNGTLVPFSFMNSILGSIPLLGDMITGGNGQGVIAAAFTVKGPLGTLDINVNPVSLLTLGFLRTLFFSDEAPAEKEEREKEENGEKTNVQSHTPSTTP